MRHGRVFSQKCLQKRAGTIAVLNVGRMHLGHKNIALGIGYDMAFSAFDLLACVVSNFTAPPL